MSAGGVVVGVEVLCRGVGGVVVAGGWFVVVSWLVLAGVEVVLLVTGWVVEVVRSWWGGVVRVGRDCRCRVPGCWWLLVVRRVQSVWHGLSGGLSAGCAGLRWSGGGLFCGRWPEGLLRFRGAVGGAGYGCRHCCVGGRFRLSARGRVAGSCPAAHVTGVVALVGQCPSVAWGGSFVMPVGVIRL